MEPRVDRVELADAFIDAQHATDSQEREHDFAEMDRQVRRFEAALRRR